MSIKYLYLDDEPPSEVRPYVREVQDATKGLEIEHLPPQPYPLQMQVIRARERDGTLDGLILDLRLDQFPDWQQPNGGDKADYRAATLAQEIRTRATERTHEEYPIVLWSTDEKLSKSYTKDDTSHDLFDLKSIKREIEEPATARRLASRLIALVEGYREIKLIRATARTQVFKFLGFDSPPSFLDERVMVPLHSRNGVLPAHEYARFILRELLETPGPLVDEHHLAARLGIDLSNSPGFGRLAADLFGTAAYSGPFATGWHCWWSAVVETVWRALPGCPGPLRSVPASERVAFLRKVSGLRSITVAPTSALSPQSTFWTVCRATSKPIDPRDGFLTDRQPPYSWQDRAYVSLDALLHGEAAAKHIQIDPLEKERFQRTKARVKKREQDKG